MEKTWITALVVLLLVVSVGATYWATNSSWSSTLSALQAENLKAVNDVKTQLDSVKVDLDSTKQANEKLTNQVNALETEKLTLNNAIADLKDQTDKNNALVEQLKLSEAEAIAKQKLAEEQARNQTPVDNKETVYFRTSGNSLNLQENLGDVREVFTGDDMNALKSGVITTRSGTTDYNQYIRFHDSIYPIETGVVLFGENENDNLGNYLYFEDGNTVFEYELEFESGLKSSIYNGELEDLTGKKISMLGNQYLIVNPRVSTSSKDVEIEFLTGQYKSSLKINEEKSFDFNGKTYKVKNVIVSDDSEAILEINGEQTNKLREGESYTLEDGTEIAVDDIISSKNDGIVTFFFGSNKIVFQDRYDDSSYTTGILVNNVRIEDASVKIVGNEVGTDGFEITSIKYRLKADGRDEIYLGKNESLRMYLQEPQGLLGNSLDIKYEGLSSPTTEDLKIKPSGDDRYKLYFTNMKGQDYVVNFIDSTLGNFKLGSDENMLWFVEGSNSADYQIKDNDEFILSDSNDDKGNTYVLRYQDSDMDAKILHFTELATGDDRQVVFTGEPGVNAVGDLVVGGNSYKVFVGNDSEHKLAIDLNRDGNVNGGKSKIVTKGGGILDLGNSNTVSDTFNITLTTLASKLDEGTSDEVITVSIIKDGNQVDLDVVSGVSLYGGVDNDKQTGMTKYGTYVEQLSDNNDADALEIAYPAEQAEALVSLTIKG